MASVASRAPADCGFTILEVVIATALMTVVALGVAESFSVAVGSIYAARVQTTTSVLALQKMEQLRALTFGADTAGQPLTDVTTNLGGEPPDSTGGGLRPSPSGTLDVSTAGYADYLDPYGQWVGTGPAPPATAAYLRRWRVEALPADPDNAVVLHVFVTPIRSEAQRRSASSPRKLLPGDALIVSVKTRKAS